MPDSLGPSSVTRWQKLAVILVLIGVALACGNALLSMFALGLSGMPWDRALGTSVAIFAVTVVTYPLTMMLVGTLLNGQQWDPHASPEQRTGGMALVGGADSWRQKILKADLAAAISRDELLVEYQPIVNLLTGTVTAFEALLRWRHPRYGLIPPMEFISLAEEEGLINAIGNFVLVEACEEAARWPREIGLAVNVSPLQLRGPLLALQVVNALNNSGLSPHRLELEITETVLLAGSDATMKGLRDLHTLGVKVALDDFGTGYSSLSYVQRFPFDRIKIDRSFISGATTRDEAKAVIRAVVGLGHSLGMRITAEGVETLEQLRRVRAKGCDEAQGFLISKSVPRAELSATIASVNANRSLRPPLNIVPGGPRHGTAAAMLPARLVPGRGPHLHAVHDD